MANNARRVVVDVDVGIDDYLALLFLLGAEKLGQIKIEAIVCTAGNTTVDSVCINLVRLLESVDRTDIPVYKGATKSLIPSDRVLSQHGTDRFADLEHGTTPNIAIIKQEPAAVAVANLILNNPNSISLICMGPLTNLALSISLYENFADSIKDVWIMGGNYTTRGNVTKTAEFNLFFDPEAAFIVLANVKKPIFMLTWDTCLQSKIPIDWRDNVFGIKNSIMIQVFVMADRKADRRRTGTWRPCDAILAATFLHPDEMITKKMEYNASIELHSSQTRGQVVLDHANLKQENVTIIEDINFGFFQELLIQL